MNKPLMDELIQVLEEHPHLYNQAAAGYDDPRKCGTACCIAGWVAALRPIGYGDFFDHAAEHLGVDRYSRLYNAYWPLTWAEAAGLEPDPERANRYHGTFEPTAAEAVWILRRMLTEGRFWE